jgi:hypothetical protein
MSIAKIKLAGCLVLMIGVAVAGGYGWGRTVHMLQIVEIGSTACGVPTSSARFGLPLRTILQAANGLSFLQAANGLSFGLGPVALPAGSGPISPRFEPSLDGRAGEVRLIDDVLYLPLTFGPDRRSATLITLHCRDQVIGSVRYQGDGSEGATFSVVRAAAIRGSIDPPRTADATRPIPTVGY